MKFSIDSREVSEMTGKRHGNLLRDIDGYCDVLRTELNFELSEFFIEGTYQDDSGRMMKKYDCTKKGCDMVANKMIGKKGILFTAAYVTRFEQMAKQIEQPSTNIVQIPTELNMIGNLLDVSNHTFKAMLQMQAQIESVEKKAGDAFALAESSEIRNKQLEREINDVKSGLVDVNLPLRTQFNDAVKQYKGKFNLDYNVAYNNIYKHLSKQEKVNIKLRAKRRGVKPIEIIEEMNLLVPAIRLVKALTGIAS